MPVHYRNAFTYEDISQQRESREDSRESRFLIYVLVRDIVDLEAVRHVPHSNSLIIGVRCYDDL